MTRAHILNELLELSAHNKRESKLSSQIQNALVVIEAFGHARTTQNISASKYGMFQEVQFNERGRILGTKTLVFQFDKSRVTQVPSNERTYHVFYSLLAGTTVDEKNALFINFKPEYFNYLNQSGSISTPGWNDEIQFGELKSALKMCGFKAKTVTQIFQVLAAILHMGNLQFMESTESLAQEACIVKNSEVLDTVAVMLGVSPSKLETCLTYKLKMIGKEVCTMFLNPQSASEQRDNLAGALYNVLFLWIVESINRKVCYDGAEEPANVVGIMDQFGFQNFHTNSFQEFCVNFSNERIHHFLVNEFFNQDHGLNAIMVRDGVPLPMVKVIDNSACLELVVGKDKQQLIEDTTRKMEVLSKSSSLGLQGVVGLMDRDTARLQSGATDATNANFLASLQRQFSSHASLSRSSQTYSFGINHFSGTVHYSVDMFLEKNLDDISPDFVNMLRDNSSNTFLSTLFQGTSLATESHPKDERTIVKAQVSSKPTRAPSMRRKPTKRRPNGDNAFNNTPIPEDATISNEEIEREKQIKKAEEAYEDMQQMTVIDQLYITLRDITFSMAETRIYNVIHIRPNDIQAPEYDHNRVKSQIRAFLVPDLIMRQQYDYANYYSFEEFTNRYEAFISSLQLHDNSISHKEQVERACAMMHWNQQNAYIGQEMVWLSFDTWKELEDGLRAAEKEQRARAKGGFEAGGAVPMGMGDVPPSEGSYQEHNMHLLPDQYNYDSDNNNPQFLNAPRHGYDDGASYAYTEDKREADGSQWGEESEWGINGLSEG
jgi:chitin synthase